MVMHHWLLVLNYVSTAAETESNFKEKSFLFINQNYISSQGQFDLLNDSQRPSVLFQIHLLLPVAAELGRQCKHS